MSSLTQSPKQCCTLDDLRNWNSLAPAFSPPARLAVIGDPVAHSLSPQMHNPALAARGIAAQYIRVQVPSGRVKEALDLFQQHDFIGVNCTIPHKFEALNAVDEVAPHAKILGAVNTVRIEKGRLKGFNSDGPGFANAVNEVFGKPLSELKVLILGGGGGAGWAVAQQCVIANSRDLAFVNRSEEKAQALKAKLKQDFGYEAKTVPWGGPLLDILISDADLIVNATSLGLKIDDADVIPYKLIEPRHRVFDMVYRREGPTPLVLAARAAGAAACDGLPLLLHQGAVSFAHWFGEPVPLEAMRQGLRGTSPA